MTHPTTVEGFDGSLQELAQRIHRMRYDKVAEFYTHCDAEVVRQYNGDINRGHNQLAQELREAAHFTDRLWRAFETLWEICKPYEERGIR